MPGADSAVKKTGASTCVPRSTAASAGMEMISSPFSSCSTAITPRKPSKSAIATLPSRAPRPRSHCRSSAYSVSSSGAPVGPLAPCFGAPKPLGGGPFLRARVSMHAGRARGGASDGVSRHDSAAKGSAPSIASAR